MDHLASSFLTLTYEDEHLPINSDGQMVLRSKDLTKFLKALRYRLGLSNKKFRYFAVGEYGDEGERPHYHAMLFGVEACTKETDICHETWGKGRIELAEFAPGRCDYIAGYTLKKMTSAEHRKLGGRPPEFARMSRNPGIGLPMVETLKLAYSTPIGRRAMANIGQDVETNIRIGGKILPLDATFLKQLRESLEIPPLKRDRLPSTKIEVPKDYEQAAKKENLLRINYGRQKAHGHPHVS